MEYIPSHINSYSQCPSFKEDVVTVVSEEIIIEPDITEPSDLLIDIKVTCFEDISVLCDCEFTLLSFLQIQKIIPDCKTCDICGNSCYIDIDNSSYYFQCQSEMNNSLCSFKCSVLNGTWFSNFNIEFKKSFQLIWCFANKLEAAAASLLVNISEESAAHFFECCRNVCIHFCIRESHMLGGVGKIVEIDESKFGKNWVFGGIERDTGDCFFIPVDERNQETLLTIIKQYILPGTTIISDSWKAYDTLKQEGYIHFKVNHFKDPETGAHTNTIKSTWSAIKRHTPSSAKNEEHLEGYLAAYRWRKIHKKEPFMAFLKEISKFEF